MAPDGILQLLIKEADEFVLVFDRTGRVSYANERAFRLLEYTSDEMVEVSVTNVFPSVFSVEYGRLQTAYEYDGTDREADVYRKNRTCFPASIRLLSQSDDCKAVIGYDITEKIMQKKMVVNVDQQIEDALKVKSEFTANVTHELRTPVNGISGNARELLEMEDDPAKLKRLNLIERGCQDMHAIINNVLDFSKLEAGKFTLEMREFSFRDMIEYAVSNHTNKINEKGLEFFCTIAEDIPEKVVGDELRIVQILNNLLSNAVKFTSVGKIILEVVKTAQVDNRIELFFLVIDSGIGIAKENQDKLFQSFSQVDASISRKFGGTGLGLNITKQLVEMMGGTIHLESEYGKGSMFSFHIWVETQGELPASAEVSSAAASMASAASLSFEDFGIENQIWEFGTSENVEELHKKLSKLVLCLEMENWEKAEGFADTVKRLTASAPKEIKTTALRMKMAVQKEDYEKSMEAYKQLNRLLTDWEELPHVDGSEE